MAVSIGTLSTISALQLFQDTSSNNTAQVIKNAAGTLYIFELDNTANAAVSYVKLYDTNGAVVVGTTVPDWVIKVPALTKIDGMFALAGEAFTTGLQSSTVTAGGTSGVTSPASAFILRIVFV